MPQVDQKYFLESYKPKVRGEAFRNSHERVGMELVHKQLQKKWSRLKEINLSTYSKYYY